jgi:hypothetical protein
MYFSSEIIEFSFGLIGKIDSNPGGKARQEKISALRHLLATSQLLKSKNKSILDLSLEAAASREEFKKAVADIVSIGNTGKYTIDFLSKFDTDIGASVSSNFLTTRVERSRNATESAPYPGRYGALLLLLAEKIEIPSDINVKLLSGYHFEDIKIPLLIWLLRATDLQLQTSDVISSAWLQKTISTNITARFESTVSTVLIPTVIELESFFALQPKRLSDLLVENVAEIDSIIARRNYLEALTDVPSADLMECLVAYQSGLIEANLFYDGGVILRLIAATLTKRFCILTGLAGSGKTKLAEAFALWLCESPDQYRIVAVGADWTSNENLLGYADALQAGQYRAPVNGALELILRAQSDTERPYFLILDEMNLSHVERYFADFLSAMESENAPLSLHGAASALALDEQGAALVPAKLALPANLFIIGTVNVDETTYMFSPKVLDRANVIEFRATTKQMDAFLGSPTGVNLKVLEAKGKAFASAFVKRSQEDADIATLMDPAGNPLTQKFKDDLLRVFGTLTLIGAEFGFRTVKEIARFMVIHKELSGPSWAYKDALDAQVLQKLMPKLHGSARKLSGVLKALEEFATAHDLPLTLEKVVRMQQRLARDGFTSFAEA